MKSARLGSTKLVALATATSIVAIAQQVMGRATRDALFLSGFAVERLPAMMMAAALASLVSALYVGRLIGRLTPARVIPRLFAVSGALLAVEWALSANAPRALAIVIYLHWALFGGTAVSAFWSVVNERFDQRTAKRYIGWIAGGGTAGGILGGVAAFGAARTIGTHDTLLVLGAMHLVCAILSRELGRGRRESQPASTSGKTVPSALVVLGEVSYLRNLAVLVATISAMEALADYVLNAEAAARWAGGAELMSFFSLFHLSISVITFLLQVLVARIALERMGLVGAMAMLPLFAMAGAGMAALVPRLWSAGVLRGTMAALGNSLYRSGYELLFGPLAPEKKRPTKTVIDVAFDRLGTALGSGLALSTIAVLPTFVPGILLVAVLGLAAFSLFITRRLQSGYVHLLEESLTVAPALQGRARPELGLSQTFGRMDRSALMQEIAALRRDNLLISGEMTSPFAWFDVAEAEAGAPLRDGSEPSEPPPAPPSGASASSASDSPRPRDAALLAVDANDVASTVSTEPVAGPARSSAPPAQGASSRPSAPGRLSSATQEQLVAHTAVLLSGDFPRIRTVLESPSFDARLAPHAIVLLASDRIQRDAVRALRTIADRITGQLTDALLDRAAPAAVRRRAARVMSACTTQRAVDGLVEGLLDDSFEVRYQCGLTLLRITDQARHLTVAKERALAAVRREVDLDRKLWQHQPPLAQVEEEGDLPLVDGFLRDRTSRSLQHVFSILALVFEREPMRLALTALSGEDENLRGTALEYLDEVLPADVKTSLWPHLAERREKPRPADSMAD